MPLALPQLPPLKIDSLDFEERDSERCHCLPELETLCGEQTAETIPIAFWRAKS